MQAKIHISSKEGQSRNLIEKDFTRYFKLLTFQRVDSRVQSSEVTSLRQLSDGSSELRFPQLFSSWEADSFMQLLTQDPAEQDLIIVLNKLIRKNLLAIWNIVDFFKLFQFLDL